MDVNGLRILCVAEIRGKLGLLNELAREHRADAIIHTGNFGFFDENSAGILDAKTLRQSLARLSPLVDTELPDGDVQLRRFMESRLSELPQFLQGEKTLDVPVYTVWGGLEDLRVLEKFRKGEYAVKNLFILDERTTFVLDTPEGRPVRLFGLGGAFRVASLFDIGEGALTIPGNSQATWVAAWQLGELVSTLQQLPQPARETRLFVTYACPTQNPLLEIFSLSLKADYTISGSIHLAYSTLLTRFCVDPAPLAGYDPLAGAAQRQWNNAWDAAASAVSEAGGALKTFCLKAAAVFEPPTNDKVRNLLRTAYRRIWHAILNDVQNGGVLLEAQGQQVGATITSKGRDFTLKQRSTPAPTHPRAKNSIDPKKQIHALFIKASMTEAEILSCLPDKIRAKVQKIVHDDNKNTYIVHFETAEETQEAYSQIDKTNLQTCSIYKRMSRPPISTGRRGGRRRSSGH